MHAVTEPLSKDEAVIVMRRIMDAPRELVWTAFTTPRHVMQWYGGYGFTNPVCEMNVRPGGHWHHVMRTPDGTEFTFDFVFLEVVKPERLVWQNADHGKRAAGGPPTCVNTMTFKDLGDRTEWQLVAQFNSIAERDTASQMGFAAMVDQGSEKVAAVLKTL